MKKHLQVTCFILMIFMGYYVRAETKYSSGIILSWNKDKNNNFSYYLNAKPVGNNKAGMDIIVDKLSTLPDYSIVIINNLSKYKYIDKRFYKDSDFDIIIKNIKKKKHLLFRYFYKKQFNYLIKDIAFLYIQYNLPSPAWGWISYVNSKKMIVDYESSFPKLVKALNNSRANFIFLVFEEQAGPTYSRGSLHGTKRYKKLIKYFNDKKYSYIIYNSHKLYIGQDSYRDPNLSVFYNYKSEFKKAESESQRAKLESIVDANLRSLPKEFDNITMTGDFKILAQVLSKINDELKIDTPYKIITLYSNMEIVFEVDDADLFSIIRHLCIAYKLEIIVKGNNIILQKMNPDKKELQKLNEAERKAEQDKQSKELIYDGDFHKTIEKADRIVIRDGGYKCCKRVVDNDIIIYETRDVKKIKQIYDNIDFKIESDGYGSDCGCCGYPGIDWYKGKKRIVLTALKHGEKLHGSGYEKLTKQSKKWIKKWLAEHGAKIEAPDKTKKKKKTWKNVKVKPVYFNQSLLRDCVAYLTKNSNIKIELSKRLNKKNDLAVNLHLDTSKEYYLRGVLLMMIEFIEKKHGIKIKIKPISDKHIVLDLNLPEVKK